MLAASIFADFIDWTETVTDRTRVLVDRGWDEVLLPTGAAQSWQQRATWMRPPVALRGDLINSDRAIHLVEGHTRYGALNGLVECGFLEGGSLHQIWIGEPAAKSDDGSWRDILAGEHMSFLDRLERHMGDNSDRGKLANRLITSRTSSLSRHHLNGNDVASVLEFAAKESKLSTMLKVIRGAETDWIHFIKG